MVGRVSVGTQNVMMKGNICCEIGEEESKNEIMSERERERKRKTESKRESERKR
jgi:hypothetical protein